MKVLVIGHAYLAPINREKWRVLKELEPTLELKVFVPNSWPDCLFELKDLGDKNEAIIFPLPAFAKGNECRYFFPTKPALGLAKFKPDIVQVEQGDNAVVLFQTLLARRFFSPKSKVIFFTWVNWTMQKSFKYRLCMEWLERYNLRYCDAALVGNQKAAEILRNKNFAGRIQLLPQLGVDENVFHPRLRKQRDENSFVILFAGRLDKAKGIFDLLEAAALLENKNFILRFIGTGPNESELKEKSKVLEKEGQVEILAPLAHEKIAQELANAQVLVLPSRTCAHWVEQFGHILIEAMATQTVVVGSDSGEIPQVIDSAGRVYKEGDVKSLSEILASLQDSPELCRELGEKGRLRVLEKFTHKAIAKATLNFWKILLKEQG